MENLIELQESINQVLRERLESFGCVNGRFECSVPGTTVIISMYGIKESSGKSVSFWEWENSFKRSVRKYLESSVPELVSCIIQIDLNSDSFIYSGLTAKQYADKMQQQKEDREKEEMERKLNYKKELASQTTVYGNVLAEQVADIFKPDRYLCHSHRDYCGMGLGMNNKGEYVYGPVWDGWLDEKLVFATKKEFVNWLSTQSDASLANLDGDPFAWGNQVITRNRLEEFVNQLP